MLVRIARKPSSDPKQEKLRQDKSLLNKDVSAFVNKLIHFKKLMNGAPNLFYKQKSKITEPIPANPTTILGSLTSEFQDLMQRGNGIVAEQLDYAKNHRQKSPKISKEPNESLPNLTKQLASWEQKYELIAEGSNPVSRFLTRRLTRTRGISEKVSVNRMRLNMLLSCTKARKALSKLQIQIVKGSNESIGESNKIMSHVWSEWSIVARTFNIYKAKIKTQQTESAKALEEQKNTVKQPDNESTELPDEKSFSSERETLPGQEPDHTLDQGSEPNLDNPTTIKPEPIPVKPKIELIKKPVVPVADTPLETAAQAFVKKWLGKKRHQFFSQNTSSYRLEIFELAKTIRVILNQVMDLLEKALDIDQLDPLIIQVNKNITSLRMLMRSLNLSEKPDTSGVM
jgi:archaellum component FlaC